MGIAQKAFEFVDILLERAVERVGACHCVEGCTECICDERCKEKNMIMSKAGAEVILKSLIGLEIDIDALPEGEEERIPAGVETVIGAYSVPYIWIDSLCILQDSDQDWREQASQMADIYEGAYLTIAATNADRGSMGCFRQTEQCYIGDSLPGYAGFTIRAKPPLFHRYYLRNESLVSNEQLWPLLQRGW